MQPDRFKPRPMLPVILTVPGLDGSGPDHWQSLWEAELPDCRRVEMADWANPRRGEWIHALDRSVRAEARPCLLVGHSLGCLAIAWWAMERWSLAHRHQVLGAMLVAPPCVEQEIATSRIVDFRPCPRQPLPFPSLLVASRNDPYASFATSELIAARWGSQLVDIGHAGHVNAAAGLGLWEAGIALLESLITSVADARHRVESRFQEIQAHRHEEGRHA